MGKLKNWIFVMQIILSVQIVKMQKDKKIVIIGAGLAGYSAATKLIENGYTNIVILEALNRTGGRIHTIDYGTGGKKLDLGAQWIHGEKGNVIWEMVNQHEDLGSTPFDTVDSVYLQSNGTNPNQNQCFKLQALLDELLDESWVAVKNFNGNFGQFVEDRYKKALATIAYRGINKDIASMMLEDAQKQVNGFYASSSWYDISGKLNADYDNADGDQDVTWKDKGFATVFDYITKKLPEPSKNLNVEGKIQLNKEVVNIKYSLAPTEKTIVKCADGSTFEADNVIVTVSLGVLKAQHKTLFTPALPPQKIAVIEKYGFGTLGKIFLKFDKPFWQVKNADFLSYSFLWSEADKKQLLATDKAWLFGIMSWNKVDAFPNLLEAFVAGPYMKNFETIPDQKIIDDSMWLLEKFLAKKLPKPSMMLRTRWLTDKYFLGSYSFLSYAMEQAKINPNDLATPIMKADKKSFLHFAGEATDEKFPSYAHGAVLSGYRAADEVMGI